LQITFDDVDNSGSLFATTIVGVPSTSSAAKRAGSRYSETGINVSAPWSERALRSHPLQALREQLDLLVAPRRASSIEAEHPTLARGTFAIKRTAS
jgi:hypothetical protein